MKYYKLVRDKIPQIIIKNGEKSIIRIADNNEYGKKLKEKLQEEVREFLDSEKNEELADILEVVFALCDFNKINREEIEKIRIDKFKKRGGFSKKIILEEVE